MNPYLKRLREQYDALRSAIEGLQTRAAEEGRDLTEDELRSVKEQADQAKALAAQIEDLTEIETRNAKVQALAGQLSNAQPDVQTRGVGGARTQDRDPGHYRSVAEGGEHSFFGDLYRARAHGDEAAARRLAEHNRALSTGSAGAGIVPPRWLTEEYESLARQGRALANAVRNIPLGDDPRPITLPKQTAGTDNVVMQQANEHDPVDGTDAWSSNVDTVVPKPTSGKQEVSRQMVDMSTPAVDLLIYGDLISVYNMKVEAKVGAAVRAAGAAPLTCTAADFADVTNANSGPDMARKAALAVRKARRMPADILAMTVDRYGEFLGLKDTTGRPIMPEESAGPMNVVGVGSVAVDGRIKGLGVIATDGMGTGALPDMFAAIRASDVVLFESNLLRFRYEEQKGPETIVLGIWGYTAVIVRQGGTCVQRVNVTAS